MSVTVDGGDGNDGSPKSGRLVTNDGHQRRNNRPHAGDKLWGFHKNSAYGFLNRITLQPAGSYSGQNQHVQMRFSQFGSADGNANDCKSEAFSAFTLSVMYIRSSTLYINTFSCLILW